MVSTICGTVEQFHQNGGMILTFKIAATNSTRRYWASKEGIGEETMTDLTSHLAVYKVKETPVPMEPQLTIKGVVFRPMS